MWTLQAFNDAPAEEATALLETCCAAPGWAAALTAGRPYASPAALRAAALDRFDALDEAALAAAHAAHPPIGRPAGGWSRGEQSRALDADAAVRDALAEANQAYERRFGRVFLICATGLTGEAILAEARRRLGNDDAAERRESTAELRKIVVLRLAKAVGP